MRRIGMVAAVGAAVLAGMAGGAEAQLLEKKALSLAAAKQVAAAAEAEAGRNKFNMAIAIVDDGGHLIYLETLDETQRGSIEVAMRKARSALLFKRPTKVFEEALAGGRTALLALPGAIPLEGGVPLSADGRVIGAIGVSGGTAPQDGQVAQAGAAALPAGH